MAMDNFYRILGKTIVYAVAVATIFYGLISFLNALDESMERQEKERVEAAREYRQHLDDAE